MSAAVVSYSRRTPDHELGAWRTVIAPAIVSVALPGILLLGLTTFNAAHH